MRYFMIMIILFAGILSCSGSSSNNAVYVDRYSRVSHLTKTCIEGHVFYYTSGGYDGGLASKLHDDGTPFLCKEEGYVEVVKPFEDSTLSKKEKAKKE